MKKLVVLLSGVLIALFSVLQVQGQSMTSDEVTYNRWSAALYAGYIFQERDQGNQIFASRFNVPSDPSWGLGGDVRFALNPFWSIEGGYKYSTLEGDGFETTIHTASIKNSFHLNRLFRRSDLSEVLDPYITLGVEQDFFDAEGPSGDVNRSEAGVIGGFGIAYRLSNQFEVFSQYEIKLTSNRLDLQDRGLPYDQIGMASGGVRIHFGSSDKQPLNLKPPMRELTDSEYDDLFARVAMVEDLEADLNELENEVAERDQQTDRRFDELSNRIAMLERRADSLEATTDSLSNLSCCTENNVEERELAETVAAGHYLQVFASLDYDTAVEVKEDFIELFGDDLDNPEEEVIIIKRKQFYEVLVGTFQEFSSAQNLLPDAVSLMPDAFIITFPRPVSLEDDYEGTVIVHGRE